MKEKVFYISVRGKKDSSNRIYSDLVLKLCNEALNTNRVETDPEYEIIPHDLQLNKSNLRAELAESLLKYRKFVVLLDEAQDNSFNPNVWFECGVISTVLDAQITFIAKEKTNIPFDVGSGINVVKISDNLFDSMKQAFTVSNFQANVFIIQNQVAASCFMENFKKTFYHANNPFTADYESAQLASMGFNSLLAFFKETGIAEYLKPGNGIVKYIDGEEDAFTELTEAVKKAKKSLRTSRFAKQSIVDEMDCHVKFMNALKDASYRVKQFDRIICVNETEKWLDVWKALADFCPNKTVIYLRKAEFSIKFELVIIDEEVSFIHFYLPDDPRESQDEQQYEKIRSTLKIVGEKISRKLANIFDRLHHRDYNKSTPVELSRTLLGVTEINGKLTEESRGHGFIRLENNSSYYYNIPTAIRKSVQNKDAENAIMKIQYWNLTNEEKTAYFEAVEKYFSNQN